MTLKCSCTCCSHYKQFTFTYLLIMFQFDPMNPNAPPIIINGPATSLHMGPQVLGPGPLYSPAMTGAPGILHMSSSGSLGSSIPFQLGSNSGLVVASNMVTGTVTTNSVSACISSPSVSTASKGGKVSSWRLLPCASVAEYGHGKHRLLNKGHSLQNKGYSLQNKGVYRIKSTVYRIKCTVDRIMGTVYRTMGTVYIP